MTRMWLLVLMTLFVSVGALAQSTYSIKGRVYERESEETVVGASVRLLQRADSLFVKGVTTSVSGDFVLSGVVPGKYILHIGFMGFEPLYKEIEVIDKAVEIGKLYLSEAVTRLGVLEVMGQAPPMTVKPDTIQFNASAFRMRQGASLEELLRRIPGMEIDDDGQITYNGEVIERIEMDGRSFFGNDPQMATRNLPSDMIKNVQVVDKKSDESRLTGMNDGEEIKVLNLEIKEDKKRGLIANLSGGYGTEERYNGNALINLFNGDARYTIIGELNNIDGVRRGRGDEMTRRVGGNYDDSLLAGQLKVTAEGFYNSRDFVSHGTSHTTQLLGGDRSNREEQQYRNFNRTESANANARVEWIPNEQTMWLFLPSIKWNWGRSDNRSSFESFNHLGELINKGESQVLDRSKGYDIEGSLHFRHTFNELGRNLYARLTYQFNGSESEGKHLSETQFVQQLSSTLRDQQQLSSERGASGRLRLAYLEPFTKLWALQMIYELSYARRESDKRAYNKGSDDSYSELDPLYSRGSRNEYLTQRIMARIRYTFGERSHFYVGMSLDPTYTHTVSSQGSEVTFDRERKVWIFSPTAILDYRPSKEMQLRIRYNGRTRQPSMSQLNPATVVLSPLAQVQGNPDLRPAFMHDVWGTFNLNRRVQRQNVNIMAGWDYTLNAVAPIETIDTSTGMRQTTYHNISGNQSLMAGFMLSSPIGGPSSKWQSFTYGRIRYSQEKSYVNDAQNRADVWRPMLSQRITWTSPWLQVTAGGWAMMQQIANSFATDRDSRTWDYNAYGEAVVTLPFDLSITTRLTYQDAVGYQDQLKRHFWLLDATLNWSFLKGKNATLQLSGYDLLRQRTTFSRQLTTNRIVDSQINSITSYVMLTLSYRFNNMGGEVSAKGLQYDRSRRYRPRR